MYNFSRKKMSSYPCLSTPKNGLLAQKMAFFVVTNTFLPLRRPSMLFYAVTSGTNFSWHPNNSFSTINILVTPLLGNKKSSILAEKTVFNWNLNEKLSFSPRCEFFHGNSWKNMAKNIVQYLNLPWYVLFFSLVPLIIWNMTKYSHM